MIKQPKLGKLVLIRLDVHYLIIQFLLLSLNLSKSVEKQVFQFISAGKVLTVALKQMAAGGLGFTPP